MQNCQRFTLSDSQMEQPSQDRTGRLAALIEEKHACLVKLRDLGLRQQALVETGEMGPLLSLLSAKHQLIDSLQRVEQGLTPYRDEDPEARTWRSSQERVNCAERAAACRVLLDAVVSQEKLNETLMLQQRQTVADRLQQVHAAARASGAYRMHARGRIPASRADLTKSHEASGRESGTPRLEATRANGLDLSSDIR
jgi:hypothetical protein